MMPDLFFHQDTNAEKECETETRSQGDGVQLHFLKINVLVSTH